MAKRFGLGEKAERTLDIGKDYDLTRERIGRIEAAALNWRKP